MGLLPNRILFGNRRSDWLYRFFSNVALAASATTKQGSSFCYSRQAMCMHLKKNTEDLLLQLSMTSIIDILWQLFLLW